MKRSLIASSFLLSLAVILLGTTHTLGWFDNRINSPVELIEGQSTSAYFYDGKGTKEDPYIITNRRHLYNLAWLQYIGHFNKSDESGVISPVYFKVATTDRVSGATTTDTKYVTPADIDCSGLALPPIGTSQYPFVGIFDGNNSIIRNYTITDSSSDMTNIPNEIKINPTYIADGKLKHCSIIGTFGVVGLLDEKVKAVDSSNASTTFTISGDTKTSVSHFYIDQVNIKPTASNTLAGLIVGYANANVSYCGSYRSRIDFNSGTSKLPQKLSNSDAFSNVSSYTLIGDYNPDAVSWTDRPGKGQQNDWGGSIDFASLSKRLTYIHNNHEDCPSGTTRPYAHEYKNDTFNCNLYVQSTGFNWNVEVTGKTNQTIYLDDGTYVPLNIDLTDVNNYNDTNSTSAYKKNKPESVLETNTGYLVGKGEVTGGNLRMSMQISKCQSKGIKQSIGTQMNGTTNQTNPNLLFAGSNFCLYTLDQKSNQIYKIKDNQNQSNTVFSWTKDNSVDWTSKKDHSTYYKIKDEFIESLRNGANGTLLNEGKFLLHGLKFSNKEVDLNSDKNILSVSKVHIKNNLDNGTPYEFYKGGLNFTLNKKGYLRVIVGTYADDSANHGLFDLFKVTRNSDHTISTDKTMRIKQIYQDSNGNISYNTKTSNSDTLAIDFDKLMNSYGDTNNPNNPVQMTPDRAFYYEIPVDAGDYFLTINKFNRGKLLTNSGYILYLDIGANAGDEEVTKSFSIEKIDFVYSNNQTDTKPAVHLITDKDYLASGVIFSMAGTSTSQTFYFYRLIESSGESTTVYYYGTTNNGLAITPTGKPVLDGKAHWTVS